MELLIAVLLYLGLIQPGTYTTQQVNTILLENSAAVSAAQSNPEAQAIIQYNSQNTSTTQRVIIQNNESLIDP